MVMQGSRCTSLAKLLLIISPLMLMQNASAVVGSVTWTGGSGNSAWSDDGNWSGAGAPTEPGDEANFTGTPTSNQPDNDGDIAIDALYFNSTESFTITNSGSMTLSISSGNSIGTANSTTQHIDNTATGIMTIAAGSMTGGHVIINNEGEVVLANTDRLTVFTPITGSGNLTKINGGLLFMNNESDYTGITTIDTGTFQLGNSSSRGMIDTEVILKNNGTFSFDNNQTTLYSKKITGDGKVLQTGAGLVILTADNDYINITQIRSGTGGLRVGNGGEVGSVTSDISNEATLSFNHSNDITYNGVIYGSGTLTQLGSKRLILTGENTYTGDTYVEYGTLQIGDGHETGSISDQSNIIVADGALLEFDRSKDLTYSGVISGEGGVTQSGSKTLILKGDNEYHGVTTVNTGILQIGDDSTTGSISDSSNVSLASDALLVFKRANDVSYGGVISGLGGLEQAGSQNLILTGANTYSGATTVSGGILKIGNGNTGSIPEEATIAVADGAFVAFDRSGTIIHSGEISGDGGLIQLGKGVLIITNNTYQGQTQINGTGTLQIGDGVHTGYLVGDVSNNGKLVFNNPETFTYADNISGIGSVRQSGTNTVILNGVNAYTGDTYLDSGALLLGESSDHSDAQIAGDVVINEGATFGGYGQVLGDINNLGGTLSPGASVGVITVGGYLQSTGVYEVELNTDGESDLLTVDGSMAGSAALDISGGSLVLNINSGFSQGVSYTFINTINGAVINSLAFDNVDDNGLLVQGFLSAQLSQDTSTSTVSLLPSFYAAAFNAAAQTPNQNAVSDYLLATGGTAQIQNFIASLNANDTILFNQEMDELSAATYANQGLQLAKTGSWLTRELLQPHHEYSGTGSIWIVPYGSSASIDSGSVSGLDTSMGGLAIGGDMLVSHNITVGAAFAASYFSSDVTGQQSGHDEGDLYQLGIYGNYQINNWHLGASLDVGMTNDISASRDLVYLFPDTVTVSGDYNAGLVSEQLKATYFIDWDHSHLFPFVALIAQQVSNDSFDETGDADVALTVQSLNYNRVSSQVGIAADSQLGPVVALWSVVWQHEFADTSASIDARITSINNSEEFNTSSVDIGADTALLSVGAVLWQKNTIKVSALYQGVFSDAYAENGGSLRVDIAW